MTSITYIGSTLSLDTTGKPSTEDATNYKSKTWQEIGKIISVGELGDTSEDVQINLLKKGRVKHVNGVRDIGEIAILAEFDGDDDAQDDIRENSGTNTQIAFRVSDPDGVEQYFYGVMANVAVTERTASTFKGMNFTIRGQSAIVHDKAPGVVFEQNPFRLPEGQTSDVLVNFRLTAQPSANVTVTLNTGSVPSDAAQTSQTGTKTFTPSNWNTYQNFRIKAINDADDVDESFTITATANGGGYSNVTGMLTVNMIDDD